MLISQIVDGSDMIQVVARTDGEDGIRLTARLSPADHARFAQLPR